MGTRARERVRLTDARIAKLDAPDHGHRLVFDTEVPPLCVRVLPSGTKTFMLYAWHEGKPIKYSIRRADHIGVHAARQEARVLLGKMAAGVNPQDERKLRRARSESLQVVLEQYLAARKGLKERTRDDYRRLVATYFQDWRQRPLTAITKDMVERRHRQIAEEGLAITVERRGEKRQIVVRSQAQANYAMRLLRALFNFARMKYEGADGKPLIADNPVRRLSQTRAWYRIERRTHSIKAHQLAAWWQAVQGLKSETARDYLRLLLLTGMRRGEASQLRWSEVDFTGGTITITDPKNRTPFTLPLSDYLLELLRRRQQKGAGVFVFAGEGTKRPYYDEPRKAIGRIVAATGIHFVPHDLRRSFASYAASVELGLPYAVVKALLNHKLAGDVTRGYIQVGLEELRAAMQRVTDFVLRQAGVGRTATVVPLKVRKG